MGSPVIAPSQARRLRYKWAESGLKDLTELRLSGDQSPRLPSAFKPRWGQEMVRWVNSAMSFTMVFAIIAVFAVKPW